MNLSETYQDFTSKLTALIREFHEENPMLFLDRIELKSGQTIEGRKVFRTAILTIELQPLPPYSETS